MDGLLALVLLYNIFRSWQSGFIISLLDLLSWSASLIAAFTLYDQAAAWLVRSEWVPPFLAPPVGFAVTALVAGLVTGSAGRSLVRRVPAGVHRSLPNRWFGMVPGTVNGLVAVALLSSLLLSLPLSGALLESSRESRLANRFSVVTERLEIALDPILGDAISQTLNMMTVHPSSEELIELPYTVVDSPPRPTLEREMLDLVNQERVAAGLPPLEMDPSLVAVARRHSADMFARGYFAHNTPEGLTPYDRIQADGIRYMIAGENLAHAPSLAIAHSGLMNSPGHRENILREEFGRVGIGIVDGGSRGLMITQNFRD